MENKTVCFDPLLGIEALTFDGLLQSFPPHFHPYYVVGLMDGGARRLTCGGRTLTVREGQLLLFNPGDSHGCTQEGAEPLQYRSIHIPAERLAAFNGGIPPRLRPTVDDPGLFDAVSLLHRLLCAGSDARREQWREAIPRLLHACAIGNLSPAPDRPEVAAACRYFADNLHRHITLAEVCRQVGVSPSSLLRAFDSEKKVSPYRYLEALRIGEADRLLRRGVPPAEAALRTGFADQSHFANRYRALMGCPPGACRFPAVLGEKEVSYVP